MPRLPSLPKDRFLLQGPPERKRLRFGLAPSTCLLAGALILGASGARGDDISTQNQLDAAISAGSDQINIIAGNLALSGSQLFAPTTNLTLAAGASLLLSNANQTVGSLGGGGTITLGTTFLTAGGNNNSTSFSGTLLMTNQGYDPTYGRFAKTGTGTLTIDNANIGLGRPTSSRARSHRQAETPQSRIWRWVRARVEAFLMLAPSTSQAAQSPSGPPCKLETSVVKALSIKRAVRSTSSLSAAAFLIALP